MPITRNKTLGSESFARWLVSLAVLALEIALALEIELALEIVLVQVIALEIVLGS